ncbi:antitoxin MazE family protein [Desulfobacter sp. UBA2225]|uniref:antitoxin MazE family protein n=1 Tax=Desulfobacter sp. UBA2225 TaxID=1961413 RepID=UPI00257F5FB5|nr:antitoxin MazE family protein [Desulfobacter sp. UBA2225]
MATPITERVQKRRAALRNAGLRPIQLWVPDTRRPEFTDECRRQSRLAAQADRANAALLDFMNNAVTDIDGWVE